MLARADTVVLVIGTPIDEFMNPSVTVFDRVVDELIPHIRPHCLVVLRSTVFPGTTEGVQRRLHAAGLEADVVFCPERIAEGHALEEIRSLPQLVGASSTNAYERAARLFEPLGVQIVRTTPREAELAKLLTNTWRYMKFAIANQFFQIAHRSGVDYNRVLGAIRNDYPRAADLPGPGFAAGPCLLKDTMQLSAYTPDHFPMGQAAMQINEGMPNYIIDSLDAHKPLAGRTLGILGMAFKGESDDPRASLSYKVRKDAELLTELAAGADHIVAGAAMIGGISYFHEFAYDLLAENERICAATFDAAISGHKVGRIQRITVISSSMVFESSSVFPTPEGAQLTSPPPKSTYGFQKLATEYFAKGAHEQYGLPYTIVRPFNCVGVGERRALRDHAVMSGNVKLAMSHVVPDLCQKVLKDQDPLHILGDGSQVRHYTYGGDLARGIRLAMESERAVNEDFNLSTARSTTVHELAEIVWRKVHGKDRPLRVVSDLPYEHDLQMRVPDVRKTREVLGFEATTPLEDVLDEVIPWIRDEIEAGRI